MEILKAKIKGLSTEMLIETFKGLESNTTSEANMINDLAMNELEERLTEEQFESLLEEVYPE